MGQIDLFKNNSYLIESGVKKIQLKKQLHKKYEYEYIMNTIS